MTDTKRLLELAGKVIDAQAIYKVKPCSNTAHYRNKYEQELGQQAETITALCKELEQARKVVEVMTVLEATEIDSQTGRCNN